MEDTQKTFASPSKKVVGKEERQKNIGYSKDFYVTCKHKNQIYL